MSSTGTGAAQGGSGWKDAASGTQGQGPMEGALSLLSMVPAVPHHPQLRATEVEPKASGKPQPTPNPGSIAPGADTALLSPWPLSWVVTCVQLKKTSGLSAGPGHDTEQGSPGRSRQASQPYRATRPHPNSITLGISLAPPQIPHGPRAWPPLLPLPPGLASPQATPPYLPGTLLLTLDGTVQVLV